MTVLPSWKRAVEGLESRKGKESIKVTGDFCMTSLLNVEFPRYIAVKVTIPLFKLRAECTATR